MLSFIYTADILIIVVSQSSYFLFSVSWPINCFTANIVCFIQIQANNFVTFETIHHNPSV